MDLDARPPPAWIAPEQFADPVVVKGGIRHSAAWKRSAVTVASCSGVMAGRSRCCRASAWLRNEPLSERFVQSPAAERELGGEEQVSSQRGGWSRMAAAPETSPATVPIRRMPWQQCVPGGRAGGEVGDAWPAGGSLRGAVRPDGRVYRPALMRSFTR